MKIVTDKERYHVYPEQTGESNFDALNDWFYNWMSQLAWFCDILIDSMQNILPTGPTVSLYMICSLEDFALFWMIKLVF